MLVSARAGIIAALAVLLSIAMAVPATAQKAFVRDALADAAIKLEAQIRSEVGQVSKTAVVLRREADAAFGRSDWGWLGSRRRLRPAWLLVVNVVLLGFGVFLGL